MVPCFLLKLHLLIWVVGACNRLPIHGIFPSNPFINRC
jgi:hypothetical protein